MTVVRKAVFPAAGLGTRFLPATKAQPKEMLPLVDKPIIQYGVEEAVASGMSNIILVTGRGKNAIEDHFDVNIELETFLESRGKREQLEEIRRIVESRLVPLGRKVYAIVNYDNFEIFPDVIDEYSTMVRDLVYRFYSGVTRYTTSSFLRAKLGDALKQRSVAPHIYESAEEATTHLSDLEKNKTG